MSPTELRSAIKKVRERTGAPFGVNLRADAADAAEQVRLIVAEQVPVASFAQAPTQEFVGRLRDAGVVAIASVGARRHAEKVAAWGIDAVIATGAEGGGHVGAVPTSLLVPQVVDAVDVPVIAAGGFFDGRGLAAALAYGAQGIAMGTRFLMTRDCPVPQPTKERYTRAGTDDIVLTTKIDGLPQRMIRNETLAQIEKAGRLRMLWLALSSAWQLKRLTGASITDLLAAARKMGHAGEMSLAQSLMAAIAPVMFQRSMIAGEPQRGLLATGMVAGRLADLPSCDELISSIVREARERLAALGAPVVA